jgi:hypothetical protein
VVLGAVRLSELSTVRPEEMNICRVGVSKGKVRPRTGHDGPEAK